jgi:hypothetical protein
MSVKKAIKAFLLKFTAACIVNTFADAYLYGAFVFAEECTSENHVAKLIGYEGEIKIRTINQLEWKKASLYDFICEKFIVTAGVNSSAVVQLTDDTVIRIDASTTLFIPEKKNSSSVFAKIESGVAYFLSRVKRKFEAASPFMNAGIEGTEFVIAVSQESTKIIVVEGKVNATNGLGSVILESGDSAVAFKDTPPTVHHLLSPWDAVQWMVYFPVYLEKNFFSENVLQQIDSTQRDVLKNSLVALSNHKLFESLSLISSIQPFSSSKNKDILTLPEFYEYRSMLLLALGNSTLASADIEKALQINEKLPFAYALKSMIILFEKGNLQENVQKASVLAKKAIALDNSNIHALLALTYIYQAEYRLDDAVSFLKTSLEERTKTSDKNDSFLYARLSELMLSAGNSRESLMWAKKAVSLDSESSYTQSALGFANLGLNKFNAAYNAFEKAIFLESTHPYAHFGMGLLKFRKGKREEGTRHFEYATSLSPTVSLFRSYLGKAYDLTHRREKAYTQFQLAKDLDQHDPTPHFFEAILKQFDNRPVEALSHLEKAKDLNNNRRLYRSESMLDTDLASKNVSVGRIYQSLQFNQLALLEGYKGVTAEHSHYASHRLLADIYRFTPRTETARVSELLQSQLLQPLNLYPQQPEFQEGNLGILQNFPLNRAGFNEFNQLLMSNGTAFTSNAIFGNNSTAGGNIVYSGLKDNTSYSIGQFNYYSDGYRKNNQLRRNITNAFVQGMPSHETSLLGSFKYVRKTEGDLPVRFLKDSFSENLELFEENRNFRIGLTHDITSSNKLLLTGFSKNSNGKTVDRVKILPGGTQTDVVFQDIKFSLNQEVSGLQLQNIYTDKYNNLLVGAELYKNNFALNTEQLSKNYIDTTNISSYIYETLQVNPYSAATFGLGYVDSDIPVDNAKEINLSRFLPKFGIIFSPLKNLYLRAASFKNVRGVALNNESIEPTQIGGFNQVYDDTNGTRFRRDGVTIDYKINDYLFSGAGISKRYIDRPFLQRNIAINQLDFTSQNAEWSETSKRLYFYFTPYRSLAFTFEQNFDEFSRYGTIFSLSSDSFYYLKNNVSSLTANIYFDDNFYLFLSNRFFRQRGLFSNARNFEEIEGKDNFLINSLGTGYFFRNTLFEGNFYFEIRNLFDKKFRYQDVDPGNPIVFPDRTFTINCSFNF